MQKLRIIFAGTPEVAAKHLKGLIKTPNKPIAAFTKEDKKSSRGQKINYSPVKITATKHNIPVYQPTSLKTKEAEEIITSLKPDIMVVVAYGLIIPPNILSIPKLGCINVHVSILPRWRGAAPIQRAILAGDKTTGITIMQMNAGLDTGDILHTKEIKIEPKETSYSLFKKAEEAGVAALLRSLNKIQNNNIIPIKQDDSNATYANKINKEEALVNWQTQTAAEIERAVRAFDMWPNSFFIYKDMAIKIKEAKIVTDIPNQPAGTVIRQKKHLIIITKKEGLELKKIQIPNKPPQQVQDVLNGNQEWFIDGELIS